MRIGILILILVIFIPNVFAQNITVDYSSEVSVGKEFSFGIELLNFSEDNYDVKIDILANGERIAQILNDGQWKSTYYYVNDIIHPNEEEIFSLNIAEYIGSADITIKIRDSSGGFETFRGYEIEIVETEEPPEEAEETPEEEEEVEEKTKEKKVVKKYREVVDTQVKEETGPIELEMINLNPKVIKTGDFKEELDKGNSYAIYGFAAFCILMIALFMLRKNKYKNEFN